MLFINIIIITNITNIIHHSVARDILRNCMNYCTRWASLAWRGVCGGRTTSPCPILLILLIIIIIDIINIIHHSVARNIVGNCMNDCTPWASLAWRGVAAEEV